MSELQPCEFCGAWFDPGGVRGWYSRTRRWCSPRCCRRGWARDHGGWAPQRLEACRYCAEPLYYPPDVNLPNRRFFCGRLCRERYYGDLVRAARQADEDRRGPPGIALTPGAVTVLAS